MNLAQAPQAPDESAGSPPSSRIRSRSACAARPCSSWISRSKPRLAALSSLLPALSIAMRYVSAAEISPRRKLLSWRMASSLSPPAPIGTLPAPLGLMFMSFMLMGYSLFHPSEVSKGCANEKSPPMGMGGLSKSGRIGLFLRPKDRVLGGLGDAELDDLLRRDLNFLAGRGVAADA